MRKIISIYLDTTSIEKLDLLCATVHQSRGYILESLLDQMTTKGILRHVNRYSKGCKEINGNKTGISENP